METLQEKISRVLKDEIVIADYNPQYPAQFEEIKKAIQEKVPPNFFRRIEHFGSTAVPGLAAKPIIDVLIEVESLKEADRILPAL
ncbi:MAG: GrpB family protein, partial [Victivallaceae bacterium]